ncbi:MAG TPA: glycoside hydrolase family 5 protein [Chthonomonadaceae bacterium]|nr:glycoside hydrolase family 5 protein [Chthonomonadaceae bacterium]
MEPGEAGQIRNRLNRRAFLGGVAAAGISALSASHVEATPALMHGVPQPAKLRGVNLGGWLVLEKWLTPSLFAGTDAPDEATFCESLGAGAAPRLEHHRKSFLTSDDFSWMADHGLNAVRIPVGYWVLNGDKPFHAAPEMLDWAFDQAAKNGLKVLLDLHGAPGSQNGWDHSGRQGTLGWHTSKANIAYTIQVLEGLAQRYGKRDNLMGIELLNEPRWDVPIEILKDFYQAAYKRVRLHTDKERVAVVIHDGFRPMDWANFMTEPDYTNVLLDTHLYQCYVDEDKKRTIEGHVHKAAVERRDQIAKMQQQLPTIVGEWSCALDPQSLKGLADKRLDDAKRAYGDAQLTGYSDAQGWFFWTYKNESAPEWSLRECVMHGWLPQKFR